MSEHSRERVDGTPPEPPPNPKAFCLRENATGKMRAIREMTDAELEKHVEGAKQELGQAQQQSVGAMIAVANVSGVLAVLQYEVHRRRNSIVTLT